MFIREKKVDCTNYREVDIIPRTDNAERATKGKRGKKKKVTEPKQKELNDKNSKRYLVQLGNGNFGAGDLHVTCTYSNEYLPESVEEAEKIVNNYLRRIAYRRKQRGIEPLKYILVTEYGYKKEDESKLTRVHHHIIMNGGLDRDEVEMMWTAQRVNWKRYEKEPGEYSATVKKMGWINADRLQVNENGIEALCKYVLKNPKGKKRWSSSRNLERPVQQPNADHKYSKAKIERLAKLPDAGKEFFEKQFPGYTITSVEPEYYEETGWHIYLKMWKKMGKRGKNYVQNGKTGRKRRNCKT
jgi:hypothetical protein